MKHAYLDSQKSEDIALVNTFLNGDPSGFEKLYTKYFHRMYIYCLKALHNEQDAQDVAQDIFIKAYENLSSLKNPGLWVAWIFTIAHNHLTNLHKKQNKVYKEQNSDADNLVSDDRELEDKKEWERIIDSIPVALAKIPSGKIMRMKYLEGKTIEELSTTFHLSESAVKMRLLRGRTQMEKYYQRQSSRA